MTANPLRDSSVFDVVILGGVATPGIARVYGGQSPRKIDVRNGYGLSGAVTVFTGIGIEPFTVQLELWEAAHIDEYNARIVPMLARPPFGKQPRALSFYYPLVSDPPIDIKSVIVKNAKQLVQVDETGLWVAEFELMPFKAPKPALAKPIASADPGAPKPQDAADQLILNLTKQVQELAK